MWKSKGLSVRSSLPNHKRGQLKGEEIADSISRGVGLIAAFIGAPLLIMNALRHEDMAYVVGKSVFSSIVLLLYLSPPSTMLFQEVWPNAVFESLSTLRFMFLSLAPIPH